MFKSNPDKTEKDPNTEDGHMPTNSHLASGHHYTLTHFDSHLTGYGFGPMVNYFTDQLSITM